MDKKQVHTNIAYLDSAKLNTVPSGEVDIKYTLIYNKMKTTADILVPEICTIISELMQKYSRWILIKNVLACLFCFDTKLNFQAAQEKAERTIFLQFQNAAQEYLKKFRGSPC